MKDWNAAPILSARNLTRRYGEHIGCRDVSFDLWPGEVLGIVGESGSGKSTLLNMLSGRMEPTSGTIVYRDAAGRERNIHALPEGEKRRLLRSELGFVHQRPSDGLRMQVSAGANIGERLMAEGARHYGTLRGRALQWLERVEIDAGRIDDKPALYSGGVMASTSTLYLRYNHRPSSEATTNNPALIAVRQKGSTRTPLPSRAKMKFWAI